MDRLVGRFVQIGFLIILAFTVLQTFGAWLLPICLLVMVWRLWNVAYGRPGAPSSTSGGGGVDRRGKNGPAASGAAFADRGGQGSSPARRPLEDVLAELDGMVGLHGVKREIRR
ncbi:MAG: hypothetical protein JOZ05_09560, partial [Acetobacteraceae bacterium]|nr:hypothetical protein [Acetobacteraceae bacterium]